MRNKSEDQISHYSNYNKRCLHMYLYMYIGLSVHVFTYWVGGLQLFSEVLEVG